MAGRDAADEKGGNNAGEGADLRGDRPGRGTGRGRSRYRPCDLTPGKGLFRICDTGWETPTLRRRAVEKQRCVWERVHRRLTRPRHAANLVRQPCLRAAEGSSSNRCSARVATPKPEHLWRNRGFDPRSQRLVQGERSGGLASTGRRPGLVLGLGPDGEKATRRPRAGRGAAGHQRTGLALLR